MEYLCSIKKPVIIQPWAADLDERKIDVSKVPMWVGLLDLELKYTKLVGMLGKPIKTDRATAMKELLAMFVC